MATTLQFRRGNSAAAAAVTGANGEIYINTQTKTVHVHDGSTAGGTALANASSVTAAISTASSDASTKAATAYTNAVSTASTDASTKAATAYSNAVSTASADASTKAATAYSNAIAYAANASHLTTGTVPTARLGTGTANSTTILYGNNVWAAAPSGGGSDLGAVAEDIIPTFDSVYDVGSSAARFYDVFVGNSVDINGAALVGTAAVGNSLPVISTSSDVVVTGSLLVDELLLSTNMITPDATTARQYMGDKGVVEINGNLDVDGEFIGAPVVETITAISAYDAGDILTSPPFAGKFPDSSVYAVLELPDGKIMVGGSFTTYDGASLDSPYIVRLNADGTIDPTWLLGSSYSACNGTVRAIAFYPDSYPSGDDTIVIGGSFTSIAGYSLSRVAKLNMDGSKYSYWTGSGGANDTVHSIVVQTNNGGFSNILIGGEFTYYQMSPANRFAQLSWSGGLGVDGDFNGTVYDMDVDSQNRVYLAGSFTNVSGNAVDGLVRLGSSYGYDSSFNPADFTGSVQINGCKVQPDDKVIVYGNFNGVVGTTSRNIIRFNSNGSVDTSFSTALGAGVLGYYAPINTIALQSDGKIILGGQQQGFDTSTADGLTRLNSDGSLDDTFVTGDGTASAVNDVFLLSDDTCLVRGGGGTYKGTTVDDLFQIHTASFAGVTGVNPPTSGEEGFLRYNRDVSAFQGYNGTSWELLERVTTPPTSLGVTGTIDVDFSGALLQTQGALTGDITYTGSNYAAGSSVTIRVVGGASTRNVTFPAGWVFVGTAPTTLAAGKTAILTVTSFGTTEADCVAAWAVSA